MSSRKDPRLGTLNQQRYAHRDQATVQRVGRAGTTCYKPAIELARVQPRSPSRIGSHHDLDAIAASASADWLRRHRSSPENAFGWLVNSVAGPLGRAGKLYGSMDVHVRPARRAAQATCLAYRSFSRHIRNVLERAGQCHHEGMGGLPVDSRYRPDRHGRLRWTSIGCTRRSGCVKAQRHCPQQAPDRDGATVRRCISARDSIAGATPAHSYLATLVNLDPLRGLKWSALFCTRKSRSYPRRLSIY